MDFFIISLIELIVIIGIPLYIAYLLIKLLRLKIKEMEERNRYK